MIHHGDLFDVLPTLEADSVDACITDPPYELGFMGKHWDASGVAYNPETWRHVLRVLKPGAHLLAFGGTRTFHRITVAIEDAGFEIRDCLSWLYGQGFPKSLDVSKAIDAAAGATREVVGKKGGRYAYGFSDAARDQFRGMGGGGFTGDATKIGDITAPATDLAKQWAGWGTAMKPSWEPVIMARKPLAGTVAQTVARYGTGAINIDACRIAGTVPVCTGTGFKTGKYCGSAGHGDTTMDGKPWSGSDLGRWPANVLLDEQAAALLDQQTGEMVDGVAVGGKHSASGTNAIYMRMPKREGADNVGFGGRGGASRFFFAPRVTNGNPQNLRAMRIRVLR